jgi:hypothetical protein
MLNNSTQTTFQGDRFARPRGFLLCLRPGIGRISQIGRRNKADNTASATNADMQIAISLNSSAKGTVRLPEEGKFA